MACSKLSAQLIASNSTCFEIIQKFANDARRQNEECEIEVHTRLEKIFEYVNDTPNDSTIQTKWTKGLKNAQVEGVTHFLDVGDGEQRVVFKILGLKANFEYGNNTENYSSSLSEQEIYDTKEVTGSVAVAPKSKLTRWQLVSHVLGHDIGYDHVIDTSVDSSDKFTLNRSDCLVKIYVPRKVFYGQTRLRIKHKAQDKFLTIVTRNGWPAATLGLSSQFYFVLHKTPQGIRIQAENTTVPDYDVLYSSQYGAIYFDRWTTPSTKQCWTINKADPLFDGDTVSFMNSWWNDSALCSSNGTASCTKGKEDEWILTV